MIENFLHLRSERQFEDRPYFTEAFLEEIAQMENHLYPKQFSYANCVKETYLNKGGLKQPGAKDEKSRPQDKQEKEDEEDKDEE